MFDLFRLPEALGSVFDQVPAETADLPQILADAGLNLDQLRGLNPQDLVATLSERGIDLSQFGGNEIETLAQQVGGETNLVEMLGRLTGRS